MAAGITLNPGSGGKTVDTKQLSNGRQVENVQLATIAAGVATPISADNPLPIRITNPIVPVQVGTYAGRPAPGNEGIMYYATDSFAPFLDDGDEWRPIMNGQIGYEPPNVATFTNYSNAGIMGAQVPANVAGSINNTFNNYNGNPEELRCSVRAMPAGPLVVTAFMRLAMTTSGTLACGLTLRDSTTGAVEQFCIAQNNGGGFTLSRHRATANNLTQAPTYAFNSDIANTSALFNTGIGGVPGIWLRIVYDRANRREFWFSFDAVNWFECVNLRVTDGAFLTPDQCGFHAWGSSVVAGGGYIGALFYSYREN